MFKMPTFLPVPPIKDISEVPEIIGTFCYIIHGYKTSYGILVSKDKENSIGIKIEGFEEQITTERQHKLLESTCPKLLIMMDTIGITNAQFYFSEDNALVDVQIGLNKFIGPGMLRDLFTKQFITQRVIEIAVLDQSKIDSIKSDKSKYPPNVIIKPSRFRLANNSPDPAYASISQN